MVITDNLTISLVYLAEWVDWYKKKKNFLIYDKIQMGSGAKSYMRKSFLIYEEMPKFFPIYVQYEEAVSHIWLCTRSLLISLYMRKILFSFLSVWRTVMRYPKTSLLSCGFFSNCSKKQPDGSFSWIWMAFALWIYAHGHGSITIFLHRFIICSGVHHRRYESHHLFQPWSESKLFCFFKYAISETNELNVGLVGETLFAYYSIPNF